MRVEALFFGEIRTLAGVRRRDVVLPEGARLGHLTALLSEDYGPAFRDRIGNSESLRILVDGQASELLGGPTMPLRDGAAVAFLPPSCGG